MVQYHVGIDVHRRSWTVAIVCGREVLFRGAIDPKVDLLVKVLEKHGVTPSNARIAYEICGCGFWLCDGLVPLGFDVTVASPCQIPREPGRKVKTDSRDAVELATLLQGGLLRGIAIPTPEERALRDPVRTRHALVCERTSLIRMVKARLMFLGIDYGTRYWSRTFQEWIRGLPLPDGYRTSFEALFTIIDTLEQEIKTIETAIEKAVDAGKLHFAPLYATVPGFGKVTIAVLATELRDLRRFGTPDELVSYVGLCPSEYSSGETIRRGRITRQGNDRVRSVLIEAGWRAIRLDPAIRKFYGRLAASKGGKKAITAVARKLLHILWAMAQSGETYRKAA